MYRKYMSSGGSENRGVLKSSEGLSLVQNAMGSDPKGFEGFSIRSVF